MTASHSTPKTNPEKRVGRHYKPFWPRCPSSLSERLAKNPPKLIFYTLSSGSRVKEGKWIALKTPGDDDAISRTADNDVKAQIRKAGLAKKMTRLRMLSWTVKLHKWVNANTAIVYVLSQKRAERGVDPDRDDLGYFGAAYLLTFKFDEAGDWKIVKKHDMSDKELEKLNADE